MNKMIHVNSNEMIRRRPRPFLSNGDKIKSARLRLGVSQEQAAGDAGISRRYFIQLETGEKLPSGAVRDKLAAALGCGSAAISSSDDEEEEQDVMEALTRAVRAVVRETLNEELKEVRS